MKNVSWHTTWGILCALVTGVLYVIIFPNVNFSSGAFFFAVPLLAWLRLQKLTFPVIALCLATGFAAWLLSLIWIRHVTWGGLLILCAYLSLYFAIWFIVASRRIQDLPSLSLLQKLSRFSELSALWVGLEFVRGKILTGFPWSPLSASQWQNPTMLAFSDLVGHYGTSFILIFFNLSVLSYGIKLFGQKRLARSWGERICWEFYVAIILVALSVSYYAKKLILTEQTEVIGRFAFIQPEIPAELKWEEEETRKNLETLAQLTRWAAYTQPDLILWPEAATPLPIPHITPWLMKLSEDVQRPILMGNLRFENNEWTNIITSLDPAHGLSSEEYAKRQLVPFGEYVPLRDFLPFVDKIIPFNEDIIAGTRHTPIPVSFGNRRWQVGALVCYEDVFPALSRSYSASSCDFLFVSTNNAWYGEEAGAYQHAAHSALRAAESRRPVIRASNNGWSGWIDELGRVQEVMTNDRGKIYFQGSCTMEVFRHPRLSQSVSLYHRFGDWFAWTCLAAGLYALFGMKKKTS